MDGEDRADADRAEGHRKLVEGRGKIKIVLPREHGAWAMLLVPYIIGAAATEGATEAALEIAAGLAGILLLYMARPGIMLLLKRRLRNGGYGPDGLSVLVGSLVFAMPGVALFAWLWIGRGLTGILWLTVAALFLLVLHTTLSLWRRERAAASEFVGIALLTLSAPLASYLVGHDLDRESLGLWLMNALYFGASVYYVKMKMRTAARRGKVLSMRERFSAAAKTISYLIFLAACVLVMMLAGLIPYPSALAFAPMVLYMLFSIATLGPGIRIRREGWAQAFLSLTFALVLIVTLRA